MGTLRDRRMEIRGGCACAEEVREISGVSIGLSENPSLASVNKAKRRAEALM